MKATADSRAVHILWGEVLFRSFIPAVARQPCITVDSFGDAELLHALGEPEPAGRQVERRGKITKDLDALDLHVDHPPERGQPSIPLHQLVRVEHFPARAEPQRTRRRRACMCLD